MRALGSCEGGISGEHLISKSIILLLRGEGDFSVSGLPWQHEGEAKILAPKNLTANCLCRKHNSALHPLDDAALFFFSAIKAGLEVQGRSEHVLVSGHDVERWLLKTVKAFAASGNLTVNRERLAGAFASDVQVLEMLDNPCWPENTGLYCMMVTGETTQNHPRFQIQPFTNENNEISGIGANILGLRFVLMLERPDMAASPDLRQAKFRPGKITINHPSGVSTVNLSWVDGRPHTEALTLKFLRSVKAG